MPATDTDIDVSTHVQALARASGAIPSTDAQAAATRPIGLSDWAAPGSRAVEGIVDRYWRAGFAVVACATALSPSRLLGLAEALDLGEPFVPRLYQADRKQTGAGGVATLMVPGQRSGSAHPSFESAGAQRFHVDGTLQPIGAVKTTILLCETPAESGGHTIVFNALGAFVELLRADPQAAVALTEGGCLVRRATYGDGDEQTAGPAFAVRDGLLVTRYSVDAPSRWEAPEGVDRPALARAVAFLERASRPGSRYYLEFRLDAGQGMVLANDRLAHGRTAYDDGNQGQRRRCLYRALFRGRPCGTTGPNRNPGA